MFNDIFNAIESQKINAVKVYPETDYSLMDSTYNDLLEFLQIKEEKIIADVENDLMETTYN
jgi:sulfur carrier protein ThiS